MVLHARAVAIPPTQKLCHSRRCFCLVRSKDVPSTQSSSEEIQAVSEARASRRPGNAMINHPGPAANFANQPPGLARFSVSARPGR